MPIKILINVNHVTIPVNLVLVEKVLVVVTVTLHFSIMKEDVDNHVQIDISEENLTENVIHVTQLV